MPLTAEQMAIRNKGVSASEIATICGLNKWSSRQEVWAQKTGLSSPPEDNLNMERGRYLEKALVEWVADREGITDVRAYGDEQQTIVCPNDLLVIATPDAQAFKNGELFAPFEVKSPNYYTFRDWTDQPDGIPLYYLPQVQWQMGCLQTEIAIVGALVHGELKTYRIPFHKGLFEAMREKAHEFWHYVEKRNPPPIEDRDAKTASEWVKNFYGKQTSLEMLEIQDQELDHELHELATQYQAAQTAEKEAKERKDAAATRLKGFIGNLAGLQGNGYRATWKQAKGCVYTDWQAICREMNVSDTLIAKHTKEKPGSRKFYVHFDKTA